jgi:glycosyltransferase involved in cell wall biosynthesis
MNLANVHIVLDGYNLALRKGTGIKTYGLTLLTALAGLGARVSVLWGGRGSPVPLLREAQLWERGPALRRRPARAAAVLAALRTLLGGAARPRGHAPTGLVLPESPGDDLAGRVHRFYTLPGCYGAAHGLFRLAGVALRARFPEPVDAWHATCPLPVQVRGAPNVTTVHDLIPLRLPWASLDDRSLFYRTVRRALAKSDLVLAVSEHTKRDLVEMFRVPPERVRVTYEPCLFDGASPPADPAGVLATYGLKPKEYVLFVGTVEPKKNLRRLLLAWRAVRDAGIPLVVAGGKGWLWREELKPAAGLVAEKRAVLLDYAPREHLPALYAGALFLAFPSLYEGFGLPPLEAMAHGCPVLASNVSSLPEICADGALYCDPYKLDDLTDKLAALLRDGGLRDRLAAKGRERVAFFGMENYRKRLAEAYAAL